MEDNTFIVNGPESLVPIPDDTIGKITFDNLIVRDPKQIALVSYAYTYYKYTINCRFKQRVDVDVNM